MKRYVLYSALLFVMACTPKNDNSKTKAENLSLEEAAILGKKSIVFDKKRIVMVPPRADFGDPRVTLDNFVDSIGRHEYEVVKAEYDSSIEEIEVTKKKDALIFETDYGYLELYDKVSEDDAFYEYEYEGVLNSKYHIIRGFNIAGFFYLLIDNYRYYSFEILGRPSLAPNRRVMAASKNFGDGSVYAAFNLYILEQDQLNKMYSYYSNRQIDEIVWKGDWVYLSFFDDNGQTVDSYAKVSMKTLEERDYARREGDHRMEYSKSWNNTFKLVVDKDDDKEYYDIHVDAKGESVVAASSSSRRLSYSKTVLPKLDNDTLYLVDGSEYEVLGQITHIDDHYYFKGLLQKDNANETEETEYGYLLQKD